MKKFIIISPARSGSTLVVTSLRQHHNVRILGEIFNDEEEERTLAFSRNWYSHNNERKSNLYYEHGDDASIFLRDHVFSNQITSKFTAVGFKILYNQAWEDLNVRKAWDFLIEERSIHVIHLVRRNLLASWVSLQIAFLTNEWVRFEDTNGAAVKISKLRLDPIKCQSYFEEVLTKRKYIQEMFKEHPKIEIEYERDLFSRFQFTMQIIQQFLGVPQKQLRKVVRKQSQVSLQDQICNYDEIRDYFRNSEYESFFHEE
jgi:LPS sulfotransferase NodH